MVLRHAGDGEQQTEDDADDHCHNGQAKRDVEAADDDRIEEIPGDDGPAEILVSGNRPGEVDRDYQDYNPGPDTTGGEGLVGMCHIPCRIAGWRCCVLDISAHFGNVPPRLMP